MQTGRYELDLQITILADASSRRRRYSRAIFCQPSLYADCVFVLSPDEKPLWLPESSRYKPLS